MSSPACCMIELDCDHVAHETRQEPPPPVHVDLSNTVRHLLARPGRAARARLVRRRSSAGQVPRGPARVRAHSSGAREPNVVIEIGTSFGGERALVPRPAALAGGLRPASKRERVVTVDLEVERARALMATREPIQRFEETIVVALRAMWLDPGLPARVEGATHARRRGLPRG